MVVQRILTCDVAIEDGAFFGTSRTELKSLSLILHNVSFAQENCSGFFCALPAYAAPNHFTDTRYVLGIVSRSYGVLTDPWQGLSIDSCQLMRVVTCNGVVMFIHVAAGGQG
jgi:hypothetical protein